MTTLFPIFGLRAANEETGARGGRHALGGEDGGTVFDLSSLRQRRTGSAAGGVDDNDLHAYVDALLEAGERARVQAGLDTSAEASRTAAAYRSLNAGLHRLFDRELPPLTAPLAALSRELDRRVQSLPS